MENQIRILGWILVALSVIHIIFPRYFNWRKELKHLQLINRQMMYVHTFFIAFLVLLMGLLCVTSAEELLQTALGKRFALGLGIFWSARLIIQFFGYSSKLWRGKNFETSVHVIFSILWIYFSAIFFMAYFYG